MLLRAGLGSDSLTGSTAPLGKRPTLTVTVSCLLRNLREGDNVKVPYRYCPGQQACYGDSLKRRGGCGINKTVAKPPKGRRRGGQFGEIFRPEQLRRTDHPGRAVSERIHFLDCASLPSFSRSPHNRPAGRGNNGKKLRPQKTKDLRAQFLERGILLDSNSFTPS